MSSNKSRTPIINTRMSPTRRSPPSNILNADSELQRAVSRFLSVKDRSFAVSGSIPIPETEPFILFFRTSSGVSHSLPFPLKTDILHQLPALNVLLAACETTPDDAAFETSLPGSEGIDHELPLVWPKTLPLATTFELANHPILDTVRSSLFPNCPLGTYLFAVRDDLEIFLAGAHSEPNQLPKSLAIDGATLVAKLAVTLPVRFRGGGLVVRNPEGEEERFYPPAPALAQGTSTSTTLHWTAFSADCEYEVEFVEQGCRMSFSYGIYAKVFGPNRLRPNPLLIPNDELLERLSPVLSLSRGRTLGIYLTGRYNFSPAEVIADTLIPSLKGSDAALYHALRLYKLTPELRWVAAGYVWPVDKTVKLNGLRYHNDAHSLSRANINSPYSAPNSPTRSNQHPRHRRRSVSRSTASYDIGSSVGGIGMTGVGAFGQGSRSVLLDPEEDEEEYLREQFEEGGAVPLQETDVITLTVRDPSIPREKVPFISGGTLNKLHVNLLLVFYVE